MYNNILNGVPYVVLVYILFDYSKIIYAQPKILQPNLQTFVRVII